MTDRYCEPWNAGLASSPSAVNRRLGRLLDALSDEINTNVVKGKITDEIWNFKLRLFRKLEKDGFKITCPKNRYVVKSR